MTKATANLIAALLFVFVAGVPCSSAQVVAPGDPRPAPTDNTPQPGYLNLGPHAPKPADSSNSTPGNNIQPVGAYNASTNPRQDNGTTAQQSGNQQDNSSNNNTAGQPAAQPTNSNNPPSAAATQTPGWHPLLPAQPAQPAQNNSSINNLQGNPASSINNLPAAAAANSAQPGKTADVSQKPAGATGSAPSNLLIGQGDLIEVDVYAAPDFDKNVRVDSNGNAVLPMIGAVKVEGLTSAQAADLIAKRLAAGEFFNDPQVSVFIKEYVTQGITVMGEVQHPGIYPVLGPRTLFDAISLAGGTTPKSGDTVTVTRRATPRAPMTYKLSNRGSNSLESNVDIYPGDTVFIATAGIVYVVGSVRTPGGYVMDNGKMTAMQALAMAQGANSTAALKRTKLVRRTATGQEEIPLPMAEITSGKKPDVPLQPDDILFIPNSASKSAFHRGLEAAVQAATGAAIYHP